MARQQAEDDDEAPRDMERLHALKARLFNVHQSNIRLLKVSDYIAMLRELVGLVDGFESFQQFLFAAAN